MSLKFEHVKIYIIIVKTHDYTTIDFSQLLVTTVNVKTFRPKYQKHSNYASIDVRAVREYNQFRQTPVRAQVILIMCVLQRIYNIHSYVYIIRFNEMKLIFQTSEINCMKCISRWVSINGKSVLQDKFLLELNRPPLLPINQRQSARGGRKHHELVIMYPSYQQDVKWFTPADR